jgi:uncharacterized membrane protein YhaH (DUF805 family)
MRDIALNNYFGAMLRYFEFNGRSTRREYWWYTLGMVVAFIAAIVIDYQLGYIASGRKAIGPATLFSMIIHIIPGVTLAVRRLHDTGKSGYWYFVSLIPFVGGLWLFYLTGIKGPEFEAQQYGPDPRDAAAHAPAPMRLERHQPLTRAQLMVQQMEERRRRMA